MFDLELRGGTRRRDGNVAAVQVMNIRIVSDGSIVNDVTISGG
jgi:hypothetical protein